MMKAVVRKTCAALAAVCLLATMVPAAALAEVATLADGPVSGTVEVDENWTLAYTVEDGGATIDYAESYPEGTADLAIPESVADPDGGEEVPVTGIAAGAFCGSSTLENYYHEGGEHLAAVTLPDSVRYIEERAFATTPMTSVHIGTGIAYVESFALAYNSSLKTVDFVEGAHPEFFGEQAFYADTALQEFSIPALTGNAFTSKWNYRIGNSCFASCSSLAKVTFEAGDPNKGSEYSIGDPSRPSGWFEGCPLKVIITYLENLELNIGLYSSSPGTPSETTYTVYNALFIYKSAEAAEGDTDRTGYEACPLLRSGVSLTSIAAGTLRDSDYYGTERMPDFSNYGDADESVWGFGNDALNSTSDAPGQQGPNTQLRSMNAPLSAFPVSRADMNYAYIVLGGSQTVTTGVGRDEDTSSVYYLYSTGVDLSGIVACTSDGKEVDQSLYELVFDTAKETGPPGTPTSLAVTVNAAGSYDVYAQGKGDYADTQTASSTFRVVRHTASVTTYSSGTETHAAAQAAYEMAPELDDPAFVVMAPASDWRACMVATALAGAGKGLAVFSDGTDEDDTIFQAVLRARVDHMTFVGSIDEIGADAIERAKIVVNDEDGYYNYFDISDDGDLALSVCETVRENGPDADNPHEWGDTAVLMSPDSCLYTASVSQYAYGAAAPVLYTKSDGSVSSAVSDELAHFKKVVIAGGTAAVPASTASALTDLGCEVVRVCEDSQAYASSASVTSLMEDELSATPAAISVADASSPACVMAAAQLSAMYGGITYACSSSAETKACQERLAEVHDIDKIDAIYVTGPFGSDPKVAERFSSLWGDVLPTGFEPGDTFEDGGLLFTRDSSGAATLTSVADASLTKVDAASATYEGTAYTVNALAASALSGNRQITSVSLGNVASIPASACKGCTALKTASFAKAAKLGSGAFSGCNSLSSVSIPKASSIPAASFKGLKKLTSVTAGSATSIGAGAFQGCSALKSASFGSAKTIGASAFAGCTSLAGVKLAKVTSIPTGAFTGDRKLKSASFGTVKAIGASAFADCAALTSAPTAKAASIGASAFAGCTSLKTVKASSVKKIGASAFKGAKKLKTADLSSKKLKNIGKQAFSGDKKLKKVTIKSTKLKKVGKKAFKGCAKKLTVKVPKAKVAKYSKLFAKAGISKKAKVKA